MPRPDDTNDIHLYFARAQPVTADALAVLDDGERDEASRLPDEAARSYVAAHLLLRRSLSLFSEVAPQDWRFAKTDYGKPFVAGAQMRFNISHTKGLAAVAIAFGREVGIDVELMDHHRADELIARQMFAAREVEMWQSERDRVSSFFQIWTLKEAVMKATGLGMALPLQSFAVSLYPPQFVHNPVGGTWQCKSGFIDQQVAWGFAVAADDADKLRIHQNYSN
jgi:4'-phosphopantetheinyl transferase